LRTPEGGEVPSAGRRAARALRKRKDGACLALAEGRTRDLGTRKGGAAAAVRSELGPARGRALGGPADEGEHLEKLVGLRLGARGHAQVAWDADVANENVVLQ
jgi:hypothetical protein